MSTGIGAGAGARGRNRFRIGTCRTTNHLHRDRLDAAVSSSYDSEKPAFTSTPTSSEIAVRCQHQNGCRVSHRIHIGLLFAAFVALSAADVSAGESWIELFDGRSLAGWKAAENPSTWKVEDGCLVCQGPRSHLFYQGDVGDHDFKNFELEAEVRTHAFANSGIYIHTAYQETGWPSKGYEIQISNTHRGTGTYRELKRTGSLYAVRNIYKSCVKDGEWFRLRVRVVGNRICIWVNGRPTVDYFEPAGAVRKPDMANRLLSHGTIALQGHDPRSRVAFRGVKIRLIDEDADPGEEPRASTKGYGVDPLQMDRLGGAYIPMIDFHIHLRGGMTLQKAMDRQAVLGLNAGVLKNIGTGWPIETDDQLREFLDGVEGLPLFVGLQVNDRDWMTKHSAELLERLDYVLGDTMIMPMPNDHSAPVKLWLADRYKIDDSQAWMERYVQHNLRVLAEPITILANPTYLPPPVKDQYEQLWTEARMRKVIQAAVDNNVALEINGSSGLPSDRFIALAKQMGAKFSFGSNNFNDKPINMTRCFEAITKHGLTKNDMYVPE
jgi:hypothetical protein